MIMVFETALLLMYAASPYLGPSLDVQKGGIFFYEFVQTILWLFRQASQAYLAIIAIVAIIDTKVIGKAQQGRVGIVNKHFLLCCCRIDSLRLSSYLQLRNCGLLIDRS